MASLFTVNIFALYYDPIKSARELVDAHVIKMTLETAQILCTVAHLRRLLPEERIPYRPTHQNHPSVRWAFETPANFKWLVEHFEALCREYLVRYKKNHKCQQYHLIFKEMQQSFERFASGHFRGMLPFATAMPDEYRLRIPATIPVGMRTTIEHTRPDPIFINQLGRGMYFNDVPTTTVRFENPFGNGYASGTATEYISRSHRPTTPRDAFIYSIWSYRNYYYNEKIDKIKLSGIGNSSYRRNNCQWREYFDMFAETRQIYIAPPLNIKEASEDPLSVKTKVVKIMTSDRLANLISSIGDNERHIGLLM